MEALMTNAKSASSGLRMKWALLGPLIAVMTMWGQAPRQATNVPLPTFEVASVKPSTGAGGQTTAERARGWGDVTGRVNLEDIKLNDVLRRAYSLQPHQLSGPAWLDTDHFDILAVVPAGAPKQQIPLMFQALLEERFTLRFHQQIQVVPAYALVVAPGGPKMKESEPDDIYVAPTEAITARPGDVSISAEGTGPFGRFKLRRANGTFHTEFASMTMKSLVEYLNQYENNQYQTGFVDLPVVDMTELEGSYQVTLDISSSDFPRVRAVQPADQGAAGQAVPAASEPSGSSVRASLEKLGLKLERRRLPIEKFVVDHIERKPTEN
jgi:uncharacterized protein (TIGR03435 family)